MKKILILILFLLLNVNAFADEDPRSKEIAKYLEEIF
jgi:hypothetical protein